MKTEDNKMSKNEDLTKYQPEIGNIGYLAWIMNKVISLIKGGAIVTNEDKAELESHVSKLTT